MTFIQHMKHSFDIYEISFALYSSSDLHIILIKFLNISFSKTSKD